MPPSRYHFSLPYRQRGAAFMVMLVILIVGLTAVFVTSLNNSSVKLARASTTDDALAKAKDALIGYAIRFGDTHPGQAHGFLPCPDVNESGITSDGVEHGSCGTANANSIGRLPWKSLGLDAVRDGNGECLWYAVSGTYKNNPNSNVMNWDTAAMLHVYQEDGVTEINPGEIVAVVIAPGSIVNSNSPTQDRSGTTPASPVCGGNFTATSYLDNDTVHGISNAAIATGKFILPHVDINPANPEQISAEVNDRLIFITRQDIWNAVQKRIAHEVKNCLDEYAANSNGKYPWAVPVTDITSYAAQANTYFGRFSTVPGRGGSGSNSPIVNNLLTALAALQASLNAYNAGTISANDLITAGGTLETVAKQVRDAQPNTTPTVGIAITSPAISAGDNAKDGRFNLVQGDITTTADAIASAGISTSGSPDATMSDTWPASCTLFSSASWPAWRNLVFYQIASGFQPNGSLSCTANSTCLGIYGSGNNAGGNGTYQAAVLVAGKKLGAQTRINIAANPPVDYLSNNTTEKTVDPAFVANAHDIAGSSTNFITYKPADANFQQVNDLVLCLDGKVNCK